MKNKIVGIIEVRTGSSRLPNKSIVVINGVPLFIWVAHRLSLANSIDDIVIATTNLKEDDIIVDYCIEYKYKYFRGDSIDVVKRVYDAAVLFNAGIIVEVTGDNPLVDFETINLSIDEYIHSDNELMSTDLGWYNKNYYNTAPIGIGGKIFSIACLNKINTNAKLREDREHVINFAMQNDNLFKIKEFSRKYEFPNVRLTVDYEEDLILIKNIFKIYQGFERSFTLKNLICLHKICPEIFLVNAKCIQKKYQR